MKKSPLIILFAFASSTAFSQDWKLSGNSNATAASFLGTTTPIPLIIKVNNQRSGLIDVAARSNTALGYQAIPITSTGYNNSGFGSKTLFSNTTGANNSAFGSGAMYSNGNGANNAAFGFRSLYASKSGSNNTAFGANALSSTVSSSSNAAFGSGSLKSNIDGNGNSAFGFEALGSCTLCNANEAFGYRALYSLKKGSQNVAVGLALQSSTVGNANTAVGYGALNYNVTGNSNCAIGLDALGFNENGMGNTALGFGSGFSMYPDDNNYCTFLGSGATFNGGTPGIRLENSMALGYQSRVTASDQIRIGNSSIASIGGYQGWTNLSDGRYKQNLKEDVPGLAFIKLLKPLTYTLDIKGLQKFLGEKTETDPSGKKSQVIQTGFIAQDVEAAAKSLGFDFSGVDKPQNDHSLYGLRYAEFVVPLVKAAQELAVENAQMKESAANQQKQLDALKKEMETLRTMLFTSLQSHSVAQPETIKASLGQNIPNPAGEETVIPVNLPVTCTNAVLTITETATGREVKQIPVSCSDKSVALQTSSFKKGVYQYTLYMDGKAIASKSMILK